MKKIFILLFLLAETSIALGTDYYVRPSGGSYGSENGSSYANAWDGFSNIDWATVDSGNGKLFVAGTHTGSTLSIGASGEYGNPIHIVSCTKANGASIDDFGIISGAVVITGWNVHTGKIYKATISGTIYQVYDDDGVVLLAHEPDGTYYTADADESTRFQITDSAIAGKSVSGAFAYVKPSSWFWQAYKISGLSGDVLSLTDDGRSDYSATWADPGEKYYIANHLDYLDSADEWYHSGNILYVWLSDGSDPSVSKIRAVKNKYGVYTNNKDWVTIEDLEIKYTGRAGIFIYNSDNYVIDGNNIHDSGSQKYYGSDRDNTGYGMFVKGSRTGTISNNTIDDTFLGAIRLANGDDATLSGNTVTDNGLIGINDHCPRGASQAIYFDYESTGGTVENNVIGNVGYAAIYFMRDIAVKNNYIYNAGQFLVDVGGIGTWGKDNDGAVIANNVIVNTGATMHTDTNGIYLDDGSDSVTVEYNTIVGPTLRGIFLHNTKDCTVRYNKIYNVHRGILFKEDSRRPYADYMTGNIVSDNQILLISKGGKVVEWLASRGNNNFGTIKNNLYSSNEPGSTAYEYYFNSSGKWQWADTYSLSEWQNERSRDQGTFWRDQQDIAPAAHNSLVLYNETSNKKIFNYNDYAYDNRSYIYFDTKKIVSWPVTIGAKDSKILLWDGGPSKKMSSISPPLKFRFN